MSDVITQLDYIFKPRSMAVIGASDNPAKWGYQMLERPLRTGYQGQIYPVNPQSETMQGLKAYPSVLDIPGPVDLAVITVQANHVPGVMQQCVDKGVRGAVLISAGFAETGPAGRKLQDEVMGIARAGGIRCVGPNGMGIWSAAGHLNNAFDEIPMDGQIAFLSQSGTFGGYLIELAASKGYGLRSFVSMGNQADLTIADYIEYLAYDEGTKAIIMYVEGVKDGRRLAEVCKAAVQRKPVILYKGGSSAAGARATLSHTASIAGSGEVFEDACRQMGLIKAVEPFQTFEMAIALISQPLPPGRRIGILGTGGLGVVATDACGRLNLEVPELDGETSARLAKMLPKHAPLPRNPVDFAGGYRSALEETSIVEELLKLDYIDGAISNVPISPSVWGRSVAGTLGPERMAEINRVTEAGIAQFCALPRKYNKPVACVRWSSDVTRDTVAPRLIAAGIPVYETPEQCARAMNALATYAEIKRRKD